MSVADVLADSDNNYYSKDEEDEEVKGIELLDDMYPIHKRIIFSDADDCFPKEFDANLGAAVKQYPCLYNNKHKITDECVEQAWLNVASQVAQSVEACQYRWRRLRQYYAKERIKRERSGDSCRKWLLYEDLDYLSPYVQKRRIFRRPQTQITLKYQDDQSNQNSDQDKVVYESEQLNLNDYFDVQLIESLKNHPCIYNVELRKTKNCETEAWNDIATHLGHPVDECLARYRRLRQYYAKERARREVFGDECKTWAFFEMMSFIEPYIKKRMTVRLLSQNLEEFYVQSLNNDDNIDLKNNENYFINDDFDLKLLGAIKKNPCVYNPEMKIDDESEMEAWSKISAAVLQTVEVCQCRYVRLRQYYAKERQKREAGKPSRWSLYEHMEFLGPFIKRRKNIVRKSNLKNIENNSKDPKKPKENIVLSQDSSNEDFDFKLLQAVKESPCIYDPQKRESTSDTAEAWNAISIKLNTSAEVCERRFIRLRQYFAKERKRRSNNKSNRIWPMYEKMKFLTPFVKERNYHNTKRSRKVLRDASTTIESALNINDSIENGSMEVEYFDHTAESDSRTSHEIENNYDSVQDAIETVVRESFDFDDVEESKEFITELLETGSHMSNDFDYVNNSKELFEKSENNFSPDFKSKNKNFTVRVEEDYFEINTNKNKTTNSNDDKDLSFEPYDEEKLKELISTTAVDTATSFYWPDFTMTVVKKEKD